MKKLNCIEPQKVRVKILGSDWLLITEKENDEYKEKQADGWCDYTTRTMHIGLFEKDKTTLDRLDVYSKKVARHEIIHAFLYESGLAECSCKAQNWALNEEMVDWLAQQITKIYNVFLELDVV